MWFTLQTDTHGGPCELRNREDHMAARSSDVWSRSVWIAAAVLACLAAASPASAQITCNTPKPGPDWICRNGDWLPPDRAPSLGCTTPQPASDWVCINGSWLPSDLPAPAPPDPVCPTVKPGPDWVCRNGDWLPPGVPVPPPPPGCLTVKPGPGWICRNGDWLPPGVPIPPFPASCPDTDPFEGIPSLIGQCVNGNWIPIDLGASLPLTHLEPVPYFVGYHLPDRIVVRSPEHWNEVWSVMWSGHSSPPPPPTVDFDQEMLIVAAMGQTPNLLYGISIQFAFDDAGSVTVRVHSESVCLPDGGIPAVVANPMDVVRVPRRDGPVRFIETTSFPCSPAPPPSACVPVFRHYDAGWSNPVHPSYIVGFKNGTDVPAAVADLELRYGLTITGVFSVIPAFFGIIPEPVLQSLRCEPLVQYIEGSVAIGLAGSW